MGQDIEIFEKNHEEWKAKLLDISFKNKLINLLIIVQQNHLV